MQARIDLSVAVFSSSNWLRSVMSCALGCLGRAWLRDMEDSIYLLAVRGPDAVEIVAMMARRRRGAVF